MERLALQPQLFQLVTTFLSEYDVMELALVSKKVAAAVQTDLRIQNRLLIFSVKKARKELEVE